MTTELWIPPRSRDSIAAHKKTPPPALGPAFAHKNFDFNFTQMPGGATLMFDLDKLTMSDYRAMRWHPQVNSSLMLMTFMIHQIDWEIQGEDKRIVQAVEENLRLIWTRLVRAMSTSLWAGYSPNAVEWANAENGNFVFIDKIIDLVPEECEVNWKMVESSYVPPAEPGRTFIPPKVPVFDGIKKLGLNYPIPVEMTFWYPFMIEQGDYYGKKLLKAAFTPWYFSTLIHLFSNRYFERFGEPLPIGRAPFDEDFPYKDSSGTLRTKTGKQAMEEALLGLRSRGIVVLPSDRDPSASSGGGRSEYTYDIEYLESQMRGADFERYMYRLDEEISLALFTPTLLMRTADQGSNSLGVQHTQTFLWNLNSIVGDMKEYIDRYIVKRIAAVNSAGKPKPIEWVPRKMGKDNPETIRSIIAAMISGGMAKVDVKELGVVLGLTLKEIEQLQADPNADPNTNPNDQRQRDRPARSQATNGPRRVGEPLATGREIAARISGQVSKAWSDLKGANLSMGYRKRFAESLVAEGMLIEDAVTVTENLYSRMEVWLETAVGFGTEEFSGPKDFVAMFERRLTTEIEDLASR
jgi:hypothetical protein